MPAKRTVRAPAAHRIQTAPAALIGAATVSVLAGRAVRTTSAVRHQAAELAFGLIFEMFVLAVRAVRAAGAMAGQTTVSALAGSAAYGVSFDAVCDIACNLSLFSTRCRNSAK